MQWHPIFAHLLRPLVEDHFQVETGMPVGEAPPEADIVLLRRTSEQPLPYKGLWRFLTSTFALFWSAAVALLCRFGFSCFSFCFWSLFLGLVAEQGKGQKQKAKQKQQSKATAALQQRAKVELTFWNVQEFKGPTVDPRLRDLDLLVELGLGIDRRLNQERTSQKLDLLPESEVSFWYYPGTKESHKPGAPATGLRRTKDAASRRWRSGLV